MASATGYPLLGVLLLALVHLVAGKLHGGAQERPGWLSIAGGISITYVFIHLIPELAESQQRWVEARPQGWVLERQVYVVALLGLVVALGLDRMTSGSARRRRRFWVHTGSFAFYNVLIGGLALRVTGVVPLVLGVLAFGAHLVVNDHSLARDWGRGYVRFGRWLLVAALFVGWGLAAFVDVPVVLSAALLGLLSGGIIMNVIKEELPGEREGRFRAFVIGVVVYTAILVALGYSAHVA